MKRRKHQKKLGSVLLFGMISVFCFARSTHAQRFHLSLFGGINHVFEYGSEADYMPAENDFPVAPAHSPGSLGASFGLFFTKNFGLEIDGRYVLSSEITLRDPSDEDTLEYNTAKHFGVTLNLVFRFLSGSFRPYILAGGGIDKLIAKEETYTSEYGYEITVVVPPSEELIDPLVNFGAGVQYFFTRSLGLRLDMRYAIILDDPDKVNNLNAVLGIFFGF